MKIQNHVFEAVNNALKIEDAPWRKSSSYFVNVAFEMVKFMARQYVEPLVENRKNIIKKSVYAHELKHLKSREQQNIIISHYIESRRIYWIQQAIPKELENVQFVLC